MKLGAMNNPKKELLPQLEMFIENNFDYIELTIEPPFAYPLTKKTINKITDILKTTNTNILAHLPWHFHLAYPIKDIQKKFTKHFIKCIYYANDLSAKVITIHPEFLWNINVEKNISNNKMIETLSVLKNACDDVGIKLNIENFVHTAYTFDEIEYITKTLKINITFDIGHSNVCYGMTGIIGFFDKFKKRITHMHIHDNHGDKDSHLPIGAGNIDWNEFCKHIKADYDKTFTLEVHSNNIRYLFESKKYFEEQYNGIKVK